MDPDAAPRCSFAPPGGEGCDRPADWVIAVGNDAHAACDAHRNDVLFRFEPKDVSGIERLGAPDEPGR